MRRVEFPVLLLGSVLAFEGSGAAASTVETFESVQANALFREFSDTVCADGSQNTVETDVSVLTDTNTTRDPGQPAVTALGSAAQIIITNFCPGGEIVEAFATAVSPQFSQSGLQSASLNASYDLVALDGSSFGTLDVALTFTGTGPVKHSSDSSIERDGQTVTRVQSTIDFRAAQLSGHVVLNAEDFIAFSDNSNLEIFRSTTIVTP
jgi:hypothetical protein